MIYEVPPLLRFLGAALKRAFVKYPFPPSVLGLVLYLLDIGSILSIAVFIILGEAITFQI